MKKWLVIVLFGLVTNVHAMEQQPESSPKTRKHRETIEENVLMFTNTKVKEQSNTILENMAAIMTTLDQMPVDRCMQWRWLIEDALKSVGVENDRNNWFEQTLVPGLTRKFYTLMTHKTASTNHSQNDFDKILKNWLGDHLLEVYTEDTEKRNLFVAALYELYKDNAEETKEGDRERKETD